MKEYRFEDKTFQNKAELFKHLKANKEMIIKQKKSKILFSKEKDPSLVVKTLDPESFKGESTKIELDKDFYYIAVNSTRILDSHDDVHIDGIWSKTLQEQQGKLYLVLDHELKFQSVVARKEDIEVYTAKVPFSTIGKSYAGDTEILVYKFQKDKVVNQAAKEWLESGKDVEASVRMQYIKLDLALDSDDPLDAKEKAEFDAHIGHIANKSDFDKVDFFFTIKEARNVSESSLVLFGSNGATGVISPENKNLSLHLNNLKEAISKEKDENKKNTLNLQLESMRQLIEKQPSTTPIEPEQKDTGNSICDLWDN